eukprot:gene6409-21866_t
MPPKAGGRPAGKPKGSKDVSPFFMAALIGILSAWQRPPIPPQPPPAPHPKGACT